MKKLISALFLFSTFLNGIEFNPEEKTERFSTDKYISLSAGSEIYNKDTLLNLSLSGNFRFENGGFGVSLPGRFVLFDKNESIEKNSAGMPSEDWDETHDFLKFLDYAQFGWKPDNIYLYAGELKNLNLGHGTIVSSYYNNIIYNAPKRGAVAELKYPAAGATVFVDDLYKTNLAAGNIYLKPFYFLGRESYLNNLSIGATYTADWNLDWYDTKGVDMIGNESSEKKEKTGVIYGFDAEFRVISTPYFQMTPYTDYNKLNFGGKGLHFGVKNTFDVPVGIDISIKNKLEFRTYDSDYTPGYINGLYDISRTSLYQTFSSEENKSNLNGYYGDIVFTDDINWAIGSSFEKNQYLAESDKLDSRNSLSIFGWLSIGQKLKLSAAFINYNYLNSGDVFDFSNDGVFALGNAEFYVLKQVSVAAHFSREWKIEDDKIDSYKPFYNLFAGFSARYYFK